jgi:type I restriction enzyme, S subunit
MDREWKELPISELYDFRSGLSKPRSEFGFGYGFLSFKDVFYNTFVPDKLSQLVNSTEQERESCSITRGDVFLTRTSETMEELGMSCVALKDYESATFNGFTKRLRPKANAEIVPEYAGYYFRSPKFRHAVTSMSSLSTRASLNNEMLGRLMMVLPSLEEQAAIGCMLKAFDDQIELNRRMNKTLEAIARAIFKSWFVDFDPVRAKADGCQPVGMDAETAALFPDSFEESTFGKIPRGWRVQDLSELAKVTSGKRPSMRSQQKTPESRIPMYGGAGIIGFTDTSLFDDNILLTGRVGTLGLVFRILEPCWPSDNTLVILPKQSRLFEFMYFSLLDFDLVTLNRGSTQPLLTQTDLLKQSLVSPPDELLSIYHQQAEPLLVKTKTTNRESSILIAMRDALLPKLISGEIRVKDAEKFVEEYAG